MNTKNLTTEEFFYFAFFIILSVTKGLGLYEGQKLFTLLVIPALFCGLLKILISSYTKRQWAMQIVLLFLTALVYYESREIGILFVMLTILGMQHMSLKQVFRLGLWVWSLCSIVLCAAAFTRIENTVYRVSQKMGLGYIFRWSLGFTHPNILHITYLTLCAFILYELAEHYCFKHFALLMIGNVLVFFYSVSYTGFGIVTLLLFGELYVKMRPKFCWLEKLAVQLVLPVIVLCSFILPLLFSHSQNEFVQKLNLLVNTRIKVASFYLEPECMSLFGIKMSYLAQRQSYLSIDSSYIGAFIHYGIIPFTLLMAAYLVLIADYSRKQKTRELVMIICFLGAGLTEPLLFNTSFKNITLFFLGEMLFRQKEGEEYGLLTLLGREGNAQKEDSLFAKLLSKAVEWQCFIVQISTMAREAWRRYRKQILAAVIGGALLGIVFCHLLYTEPKGYVVPRKYTDWSDKTSVYPKSADDLDYEGYRIMNYQNPDTPMQVVDGRMAILLETARYYVGSLLLGGLFGYLIGTGTVLLTSNERREIEKRE